MNKPLRLFLLSCPLALATLLIPSFLGGSQILSSVFLLAVGILMLVIDWHPRNVLFYVAVMISGPISEAIAIYFGVWTYADPFFFGVPLWLLFVWGNAGIYFIRLKDVIFSLGK